MVASNLLSLFNFRSHYIREKNFGICILFHYFKSLSFTFYNPLEELGVALFKTRQTGKKIEFVFVQPVLLS